MSSVLVWGDERGLVALLESRAVLTVARHCADPAEALALVGAGVARVVILAGPSADVGAGFVEALHRVGGAAVALVDDEAERLRLRRLGVGTVPSLAEARDVEEAVSALGGDARAALPDAAADRPAGEPSPRTAEAMPATPGRITTVWGTGGAPGRSLLALNLAVELALTGRSVALIDADTHGASLASALGLLDETAGLVRLCRAVEAGALDAREDSAAFSRVSAAGAVLRFTSGLPRPERWAEVSAAALTRALRAVAVHVQEVVVDVAAPVERDDALAMDSFAPQRNDATLAAIAASDRLFAVGGGDPVGLPRLIRLCEEAATLPAGPLPVVVLNRVRAAVSGHHPERAVRRAWERFGPRGLTPQHFLPDDPAAADASLLAGRTLAEAAPRSRLRRAISALAAAPGSG